MYFDDELCNLLANPDENRSELMTENYRNDGKNSIDNIAAERAMKPIIFQR